VKTVRLSDRQRSELLNCLGAGEQTCRSAALEFERVAAGLQGWSKVLWVRSEALAACKKLLRAGPRRSNGGKKTGT
jgi:hypothetical protein